MSEKITTAECIEWLSCAPQARITPTRKYYPHHEDERIAASIRAQLLAAQENERRNSLIRIMATMRWQAYDHANETELAIAATNHLREIMKLSEKSETTWREAGGE